MSKAGNQLQAANDKVTGVKREASSKQQNEYNFLKNESIRLDEELAEPMVQQSVTEESYKHGDTTNEEARAITEGFSEEWKQEKTTSKMQIEIFNLNIVGMFSCRPLNPMTSRPFNNILAFKNYCLRHFNKYKFIEISYVIDKINEDNKIHHTLYKIHEYTFNQLIEGYIIPAR